MDNREAIRQFSKMKVIWNLVTVSSFMLMLFIFFLSSFLEGNAKTYAVFGAISSMIPWLIYTVTNYHCPNCGSIPMSFGSHGGVVVNPDSCDSCGAKFKDENL